MGSEDAAGWSGADSRAFLDHGELLVPRRDEQTDTIVALLPERDRPLRVLELCCGEGLLSNRILTSRRSARITAIDGSAEMVNAARAANASFGDAFRVEQASLEGYRPRGPLDAIVSSLAIHHLDDAGKRDLYRAAADALVPGGRLLIADLVRPRSNAAVRLAAREWDASVAEAARLAGREETLALFRQENWNHFALAEPDPIDRPAPLAEQLDWLREAGFEADVYWLYAGHAVYGGTRR